MLSCIPELPGRAERRCQTIRAPQHHHGGLTTLRRVPSAGRAGRRWSFGGEGRRVWLGCGWGSWGKSEERTSTYVQYDRYLSLGLGGENWASLISTAG